MKNMMREYLGNEYTDNKVKNFCRYWLKAAKGSGDEWRAQNDLDCLYFDGDLKADTLMSAWTPIKWVADHVNEENGMKFYKVARDHEDPCHYLKLLEENPDVYLPRKLPLVQMLYRFLELAELRCNFICLPDREMNMSRYRTTIGGRDTWLYDEVPVTLSHIFDPESLGRFFMNRYGEVDRGLVTGWIISEHLEMGFKDGVIDKEHVIPYSDSLSADTPRWFTGERELRDMLQYDIDFLMGRLNVLKAEVEHRSACMEVKELPDGITSGVIRSLYEKLVSLPHPYVYISKYWGRYNRTGLYHLTGVRPGYEKTQYGVDSMGIELPMSRYEWLDLILEPADGSQAPVEHRIKVDSLYICDKSPEDILKEHSIFLPERRSL